MGISEMIDVLTAYRDGKEVECKGKSHSAVCWGHVPSPKWDFSQCDYRVLPEPLVIYKIKFSNGSLSVLNYECYTQVTDALARHCGEGKVVKFVEEVG